MQVTATLKLVLRELPDTSEHDGLVHMALTNEPRGLPARLTLPMSPLALACPLTLGCPLTQWKNACTKAEQIRATGVPALLVVEAHIGVHGKGLVGLVKRIEVVAGKAPTAQPVG
jgi:hypothetical protein